MKPEEDHQVSSNLRTALVDGSYQSLTNLYFMFVRGVYIILFARIVGVDLYGQYVYSQSWYLVALSVAVWGMNELVIAESIRTGRLGQRELASTGLLVRLVMAILMASLMAGAALIYEPDAQLRLLILIYAQGVVVRSLTGWFVALFVSRQSSKYVLYWNVPFLTLEVTLSVILALQGQDLVAIALTQCVVWWLTLLAAWYLYQKKFGAVGLVFSKKYALHFLQNGSILALAAFMMGWLGPGLLILYRYLSGDASQLGEAAFMIQVLVILGQAIKVVSNSALPPLNQPAPSRWERQRFFCVTAWQQALFLGGMGYLLGFWCLPPLLLALIGTDFIDAAILLSRFGWLIIPLLVIYSLRLVLISNRLNHGFLAAIVAGVLILAIQLFWLAGDGTVSLEALITALGVAYCGIGVVIIALIQRRLGLLDTRDLLLPPLVLAAGLGAFFLLRSTSAALGLLAAALILVSASVRGFRQARAQLPISGTVGVHSSASET